MRRGWRVLIGAGALAAAAATYGFISFATVATRQTPPIRETADAIVALTGGQSRIDEASRLLRERRARRLLISGVNRRAGAEEVQRLTGLEDELFECCVDIGYAALDTIGNADETKAWAQARGFTSLIVVTASYHMPRSLAELERVMPDVRLVPHAVVPKSLRAEPWWLHAEPLRILLSEYAKLVPSVARLVIARLTHMGAAETPFATPAEDDAPTRTRAGM